MQKKLIGSKIAKQHDVLNIQNYLKYKPYLWIRDLKVYLTTWDLKNPN